jgi:hypothetical protein
MSAMCDFAAFCTPFKKSPEEGLKMKSETLRQSLHLNIYELLPLISFPFKQCIQKPHELISFITTALILLIIMFFFFLFRYKASIGRIAKYLKINVISPGKKNIKRTSRVDQIKNTHLEIAYYFIINHSH